ncbi:hypothetical protein OS493_005576 [Desmophyllum pertusum]|uniref:ERCC4 domain-containing protein n=1 Tax=Desmophyllum pertusum TaxID=174260 RepID=A0A9W9YV93_9CNID|nr:hypothetical protein OS493_005576 [Desmophyllum pertusum]
MGTAPKGPSVDCLANSSNLRTENGDVVAVMESDDEDEDAIRPVGKATSRRRQALSSPCSQGFKRPVNPGKDDQRHGLSSRHVQLGSESDEEFETDKSAARGRSESVKTSQVKARAQKRNSLEITAKQGTRKSLDSHRKGNNKRLRTNHFVDDEAELSGSDINNFSSDETDDGDEEEMDSFIDDATQLTQRTPSAAKPRHASSPVDMMAVYRQSLQSPLCGALNFRTPVFHKQRNKYKMVYKNRSVDEDSQSESEAEETYESESVLENEVEIEDENEAGIEHESEAGRRGSEGAQRNAHHARADVSFEESQIGRPVKRMKRKRILDDSFDGEVSPKLSKQRNLSETCNKKNAIENNTMDPKCNDAQLRVTQPRKGDAVGNVSTKSTVVGDTYHGDFVKSSQALANKKNCHDNYSALSRSAVSKESMRRSGAFHDEWNNDISDSELLVALDDKGEQASTNKTSEKKPPSRNHDQDLEDIAVAMDMTDNDVSMEISALPNFSLGFDFLWEVISTNRETVRDRNNSKDNSASTSERRNENCSVKPSLAMAQDKFDNSRKSTTEFSDFTKIAQHSKQTSERSCQRPSDLQTENKASVAVRLSCTASKSTTIAPRKVTNSNISAESSLVTNQSLASNKSLTLQNKSSPHNDGQRAADVAHAKLQVVSPSCRPNNLRTRPAISPLLTVVSLLRLKHNIKADVCQLTSCDYIVSNRMAVKRKTASDVANGANSHKLVECMRRMCDLYDRPCLIIEKDRVKPEKRRRTCECYKLH